MATREAIAIMRDQALATLRTAADEISEATKIAPPELLDFDRDRDYLHAAQLQGIAAWLEALAGALARPPETANADPDDTTETAAVTDYAAMTKAELTALADKRQITYTSRTTKDELVEAIEANDVLRDAVDTLAEGDD